MTNYVSLADLIGRLQDLQTDIAATLSEDAAAAAEVRLARQSAWPMQHHLSGSDPVWNVDPESGDVTVYLAEAGQVHDAPYLPGDVAEALGWLGLNSRKDC
jgi:hypothetical protein